MKTSRNKRDKGAKRWAGCLGVGLLLVVWEVLSRTGVVSPYLLPPLSKVMVTLWKELLSGQLLVQIGNSLTMVLYGMIISFGLALLIAVLCTWLAPVESFVNALCTIFNPLPGVALLPLIMLWFGVGNAAMLALIVHGVLWPLITNLLTGFRSTPKLYRRYADNIGLSPVQKALNISLLSVMPYFISGLRIGWGRAWRALISAEMIFGLAGSKGGLGYYIYTNRAYAAIDKVMAGVVVIVLIGLLIESCFFRWLENTTVRKWGMTDD